MSKFHASRTPSVVSTYKQAAQSIARIGHEKAYGKLKEGQLGKHSVLCVPGLGSGRYTAGSGLSGSLSFAKKCTLGMRALWFFAHGVFVSKLFRRKADYFGGFILELKKVGISAELAPVRSEASYRVNGPSILKSLIQLVDRSRKKAYVYSHSKGSVDFMAVMGAWEAIYRGENFREHNWSGWVGLDRKDRLREMRYYEGIERLVSKDEVLNPRDYLAGYVSIQGAFRGSPLMDFAMKRFYLRWPIALVSWSLNGDFFLKDGVAAGHRSLLTESSLSRVRRFAPYWSRILDSIPHLSVVTSTEKVNFHGWLMNKLGFKSHDNKLPTYSQYAAALDTVEIDKLKAARLPVLEFDKTNHEAIVFGDHQDGQYLHRLKTLAAISETLVEMVKDNRGL